MLLSWIPHTRYTIFSSGIMQNLLNYIYTNKVFSSDDKSNWVRNNIVELMIQTHFLFLFDAVTPITIVFNSKIFNLSPSLLLLLMS